MHVCVSVQTHIHMHTHQREGEREKDRARTENTETPYTGEGLKSVLSLEGWEYLKYFWWHRMGPLLLILEWSG